MSQMVLHVCLILRANFDNAMTIIIPVIWRARHAGIPRRAAQASAPNRGEAAQGLGFGAKTNQRVALQLRPHLMSLHKLSRYDDGFQLS
jgi:hypothetical protein